MLSEKNIEIPKKLFDTAKASKIVKAAIVCPENQFILESTHEATKESLIEPIFVGNKNIIEKEAKKINWDISSYKIIHSNTAEKSATEAAIIASKGQAKLIIKGHLHTDILMKAILKKNLNLIRSKRLSHLWHMTLKSDDKPLFITDGALNVLPRVDIKMHILRNAIDFAIKTGVKRPNVAILSGTEDPIASLPSSLEAQEITKKAKEQNFPATVFGPLAFDNAVSKKAAEIKNIENKVAGNADIILVPNLETGNSLVKMMVYFMGACAAGIIVGGKVPIVVTSRADDKISRLASIAAAIIAIED